MASDNKDHEFDDNNEGNENSSGFRVEEDVVDLDHGLDTGLSAGGEDYPEDYADDLAGDLDVEITGDENIDFADEDDSDDGQKGGAMKKMLAPVLVLVVAAGAGGFIVMNPQILGGGGDKAAAQSPMAYVAEAPVQDITENNFAKAETPKQANDTDMFSSTLPQPTATQNEVPRPPEPETEIAENNTSSPGFQPPAFPDAGDEVIDLTEQGSADQQVDNPAADITASPAKEEELAQELFNLKFSDEEPSAGATEEPAPVAVPAPVAEKTSEPVVVPEKAEITPPVAEKVAPVEEIKLAQAEVKEVTDAQPPKMPEQISAPKKAQPAPVPVAEAPKTPDTFQSPMEQTSGSANTPVERAATSSASDVYYDGRIPTGPMAAEAGPRKIDPVMEPAQQFVVVKKSHESGDFESMVVSASRALELKRYDSALDMYEQLYQKNPRDPRVLMGKAVAQQNLGMTDAAIMSYEQVIEVNPRDTSAMLNMLGLIRQQYPEVALRRLMDLYDRHPDNAGIAAQIGVTQADMKHYQEALHYMGIASSLEPQNAQHAYNTAIIADRAGNTGLAIDMYEKALELDAVYSSGRSISRDAVYDRLAVLRRR